MKLCELHHNVKAPGCCPICMWNEIERLQETIGGLWAMLGPVEWKGRRPSPDSPRACPYCGGQDYRGHKADCALAAALVAAAQARAEAGAGEGKT